MLRTTSCNASSFYCRRLRVPSIPTLRTTSCNASSFYCRRLRVPSIPTTCGRPEEAITMRAHERHGDSSHSVDWCTNPSQEICAVPQNVLRNAQAADILQGNLVTSLLKPLKSPFTELSFFPAFLLKLSQLPNFFALYARRIIWALQSVSALFF